MADVKRVSKNDRLLLIAGLYSLKVGRPFTMEEVANWAMAARLWPVPTINANLFQVTEWNRRFDAATAAVEESLKRKESSDASSLA